MVQKSGQQTLLLDLGLPLADSLALLGLESSFHFGDALRHLRRLTSKRAWSSFMPFSRHRLSAIEDSGKNLLEGTRQSLAQFVIDKVAEYITRMHLAISRPGQSAE